jgi:integrase
MPKLTDNRIPSYRLHKQSGQAVVTLNGADLLLGKHGSAASKAEYNRVTSEWIANGRQRPIAAKPDLTITELIARYRVHVQAYYRRADGSPTGEADNIGDAMKPLRILYGATPANQFSPLKLKTVREAMINPRAIDSKSTSKGWCRNVINHHIHRICAVFSWGVENELVPAEIPAALREVKVLLRGRSKARESLPVQPVADSIVELTIPHLTTVVNAMVRVQRLTGARPSEVIQMRTADINRNAAVWLYMPPQHKTAHHGRIRSIAIGPRAQEILRSYLKPLKPLAFIFSPADSAGEMREARRTARKTPQHQGNTIGSNRRRKPRRSPGDRYTAASLRRAVTRACAIAFPVPDDIRCDAEKAKEWRRAHHWHPNQLRHSAATEIERKFGIEGAQVALDHATPNITKTYVARNQAAASRIAAEVG